MRLEEFTVPEFSLATSLWGNNERFADVVAGVAAAGFSQCELFAARNLADDVSDGKRRRVLNQHGVWARTVHTPTSRIDLSTLDEDVRRADVAAVAACLEPMAALGGFAAIVHPTGGAVAGFAWRTPPAARTRFATRWMPYACKPTNWASGSPVKTCSTRTSRARSAAWRTSKP